ncbi:hypothetical protein HY408_02355 [Candidatus Gottesmanbacteria bacterium]|nr:hypothetical protein [Candidatus Gottesmanbacteria bacterium]
MNKIVFITTLIVFMLLVSVPLHAKGKDESPGQAKKTASQDSNKNDQNKAEENQSESGKKAEETTVIIGSVTELQADSVVIEDKEKQKKTVKIDKETPIIDSNKKMVKLGTLKLKDMIALISSDSGKTSTGSAVVEKVTKIYVKEASTSAQRRRQAVAGVITGISGSEVTIAHLVQRDRIWKLSVSADTKVVSKDGESTGVSGLEIGMRIAAVGDRTESGILATRRVHVIPGKARGVFEKNPVLSVLPTPTASVSATPSASASATPSTVVSPSPSATVYPTLLPSPVTSPGL